jgi:hypothetical protein
MGMDSLSDVKLQRLTASGAISVDRCRVKAFSYIVTTAAVTVQFKRGGTGGTVIGEWSLPVGDDTIYLQEDGMLLADSPFVTFGSANLTSLTVQYA